MPFLCLYNFCIFANVLQNNERGGGKGGARWLEKAGLQVCTRELLTSTRTPEQSSTRIVHHHQSIRALLHQVFSPPEYQNSFTSEQSSTIISQQRNPNVFKESCCSDNQVQDITCYLHIKVCPIISGDVHQAK